METNTKQKFLSILLVVAIVIIGWWASNSIPKAFSESPPGMQAIWATSSQITLSNATAYTLFASSTCSSRVITTRASEIMFKLADYAGVLDANTGHKQAASTTVAYDAGIYGCSLWTAVAVSTTTNADITVTEFRGFR